MIYFLFTFLNLATALLGSSDSESSDDESTLYICPTPATPPAATGTPFTTGELSLGDLADACPTPSTSETPFNGLTGCAEFTATVPMTPQPDGSAPSQEKNILGEDHRPSVVLPPTKRLEVSTVAASNPSRPIFSSIPTSGQLIAQQQAATQQLQQTRRDPWIVPNFLIPRQSTQPPAEFPVPSLPSRVSYVSPSQDPFDQEGMTLDEIIDEIIKNMPFLSVNPNEFKNILRAFFEMAYVSNTRHSLKQGQVSGGTTYQKQIANAWDSIGSEGQELLCNQLIQFLQLNPELNSRMQSTINQKMIAIIKTFFENLITGKSFQFYAQPNSKNAMIKKLNNTANPNAINAYLQDFNKLRFGVRINQNQKFPGGQQAPFNKTTVTIDDSESSDDGLEDLINKGEISFNQLIKDLLEKAKINCIQQNEQTLSDLFQIAYQSSAYSVKHIPAHIKEPRGSLRFADDRYLVLRDAMGVTQVQVNYCKNGNLKSNFGKLLTAIRIFLNHVRAGRHSEYTLADGCTLQKAIYKGDMPKNEASRKENLSNARFIRKAPATASAQPNGGDSLTPAVEQPEEAVDLTNHPRPSDAAAILPPEKYSALPNVAGTAPQQRNVDPNGTTNTDNADLTDPLNELTAPPTPITTAPPAPSLTTAQNLPPVHMLPPPPAPVRTDPEGMTFDELIDELINEMHQPNPVNPVTEERLAYWGKKEVATNSEHEKEMLRFFFRIAYGTHLNSIIALKNYKSPNTNRPIISLPEKSSSYYAHRKQPITVAHYHALRKALGLSEDNDIDKDTVFSTKMITAIRAFINQLINNKNLKYSLVDGCTLTRPPKANAKAITKAPGRLTELEEARFIRRTDATASAQPNGGDSLTPAVEQPEEAVDLTNHPRPSDAVTHPPAKQHALPDATRGQPLPRNVGSSDDGNPTPSLTNDGLEDLINKGEISFNQLIKDLLEKAKINCIQQNEQTLSDLFQIAYQSSAYSVKHIPAHIKEPRGSLRFADDRYLVLRDAMGVTQVQVNYCKNGNLKSNFGKLLTAIRIFLNHVRAGRHSEYTLADGCTLQKAIYKGDMPKNEASRKEDLKNARFFRQTDATGQRSQPRPNGGSCRPETIILDTNDKPGGDGSGQLPGSSPFLKNLPSNTTQGTGTTAQNSGTSQPPQNNGNQATLEAHAQHPKRGNFFDAVARFRPQNAIESEDGALNRFELEGHLNEMLRHELHTIVDRYEKSIPIDEFDFQRFMNALEDDLAERGFNVEALRNEVHFRELLAHELHAIVDLNEKSIRTDYLDIEALLKEKTVLERMETVLAERGWFDGWRENALNAIVDSYDALALQEKAEVAAIEAFGYANAAMEQVNRLAVAAMLLALEYHHPVGREGALVSWN